MRFSLTLSSQVLRTTPHVLEASLAELSDAWVHADEGPGTWSPYQVVGHLTHIEETDWIDRTRHILELGTRVPFEPVDREAGFVRFRGWSLAQLLERFATLRRENLRSLDELVDAVSLERRGVHPDFGEVTLAQLIATWVVHDLNHLVQISTTMARQYADAVGPWRAFLPVVDAP